MILNSPTISGSLTVTGNIITSGSITISGSIASASYATNADLLDGLDSTVFTLTSSFNTTSASLYSTSASLSATSGSLSTASGSFNTRVTALEATGSALSSSLLTVSGSGYATSASLSTDSGSFNSRVATIESKYATTGSNNFRAPQYISDTTVPTGFSNTTGSIYTDGGLQVTKDSYFSGSMFIKGNLTIYGTQSVAYITSSQLNIATNLITVNTATPSVRFGGLAVYDSGSTGTGATGSLLWDSQNNGWVYQRESGSTYAGGMLISGPRRALGSNLGDEQGLTACMIPVAQGGDHITSSLIYHDSSVTCIQTAVIGTSTACFAGVVCSNGNVLIGGSGTANYLPKFTGASTIGNSLLSESGTVMTLNPSGTNYAVFKLNGSAGYGSQIHFGEATGGYSAAIMSNVNVGTGLEFYSGGVGSGGLVGYWSSTGLGIGSTSSGGYRLQVTGTTNLTGALTGTSASFSSSVTALQLYTTNALALQAQFNSTTNNPYIRFDESSNAKFFIGQRAAVSGSGGVGYDFYSVAGNDIRFFTGGSSTTALCIDTSRNVGIGTNSPARIIHTYGSGAGAEWILEDSASSANVKKFNVLVSSGLTQFRALNDANNGGTIWLTANNSTGNVGIGTSTVTTFATNYTALNINAATGYGSGTIFKINNVYECGFYSETGLTTLNIAGAYAITGSFGTAFKVTSGGNVLIGTTTDAGYKLDVDGTARVTGASFILGTNTLANNNQLSINSASGYAQRIAFKVAGTDQWLIGNGAASQNTNFELYNTNGQMALSFVKSTSAATFYGSVTASSFFESSDSRLKTLIQDNYQTKGIASITPKLYTKNGKVELGYYAQDFVGVLDSAVSKGSDDMLSLSYREVLVAKVYALEQRIKELETKFN